MSKKSNLPLFLLGGAGVGLFIWGSSKVSKSDLVNAVNIVTGGALSVPAFFMKYYPMAVQSEQTTNVPALVTLAQAAVESGYGKYAPGFNFFGIKNSSSWHGQTQKLKTWECGRTGIAGIDRACWGFGLSGTDNIKDEVIEIFPPGSPQGNASCNAAGSYSYRVYGVFRAYSSPLESFIDHGNFLIENSRYKPAFITSTPEAFALAVAKAGYSSAPNYGKVLTDTIAKARNVVS